MIKLSQLLGLIFSVSVSFQNAALAEPIANNLDSRREPILTEIQQEIDPTVRRLTPVLNTWIIVAVLVASATATTAIFLFVLSVQKIQQSQHNINTIKKNMISDLNQRFSESQTVLDELQSSVRVSQKKVEKISSQTLLSGQSEADSSSSLDSII